MDIEKLKKMEDAVRIGGKGSVRRKHKHIQTSSNVEEKRLQATLGKLSLNQMPGIQQVSVQMKDGNEIIVRSPKVQGSVVSNLFVITGDVVRVPNAAKKEAEAAAAAAAEAAAAAAEAAQAEKLRRQVQGANGKKAKKPRNRIRCRNKGAQMLKHMGEAGDSGAQPTDGEAAEPPAESEDRQGGGDVGPKEPIDDMTSDQCQIIDDMTSDQIPAIPLQEVIEDEANLSADSDKTVGLPSDNSDMDQTVVGDNESLAGVSIFSQEVSKGSDAATEIDYDEEAAYNQHVNFNYDNYSDDDDDDAVTVHYTSINHDDDVANYEPYNHIDDSSLSCENLDINMDNISADFEDVDLNDNDEASDSQYEALEEQYEALEEQYEALEAQYGNYDDLDDVLAAQYEALEAQDDALNGEYEAYPDQITQSSEKESFEDKSKDETEDASEDATEDGTEAGTEAGTDAGTETEDWCQEEVAFGAEIQNAVKTEKSKKPGAVYEDKDETESEEEVPIQFVFEADIEANSEEENGSLFEFQANSEDEIANQLVLQANSDEDIANQFMFQATSEEELPNPFVFEANSEEEIVNQFVFEADIEANSEEEHDDEFPKEEDPQKN
ncbi:hypothetical protein KR074_009451 [Drosophila pseudoananassae]|nr:hypothetical protein KR074_009451 [Drosophila pseudoananassae]